MNYVIDIGNTKTKTAIVNNRKVTKLKSFDTDEFMKNFRQFFQNEKTLHSYIISSVIPLNAAFLKFVSNNYDGIILNNKTLLPFINHYKTKNTLGNDRIANIAGAVTIYPQKNILAIDAGTCITYDLITRENQYIGGAISPGINMRFSSLNQFTGALPLLKPKKKPVEIIGTNTTSSIQSGVINGVIFEITAYIHGIKKSYPDIKVILCGGDSSFLADRLKNSIFVCPNLTLMGLNSILIYNRKAPNAS